MQTFNHDEDETLINYDPERTRAVGDLIGRLLGDGEIQSLHARAWTCLRLEIPARLYAPVGDGFERLASLKQAQDRLAVAFAGIQARLERQEYLGADELRGYIAYQMSVGPTSQLLKFAASAGVNL